MQVSELRNKPLDEILSCIICHTELRDRQGQPATVESVLEKLAEQGVPENYTVRLKCNYCHHLVQNIISELIEIIHHGLYVNDY